MTTIISALDEISANYDAVFVDLWGCLHDGVKAHKEAVAALQTYRRSGGAVVLLTNAPRPRRSVATQLAGLGAPEDCYDVIVTSGDSAQAALAAGLFGKQVYHIGETPKDDAFFIAEDGTPLDILRVPLSDAQSIVCTGLFDDGTETPEDYRHTILTGVNNRLPLLCANPDIVVDKGDQRLYCAGAIAAAYSEAGGQSHYFGKPHAPIYALARQRLTETTGRDIPDNRILAIGDGIKTDIAGAMGEGIDALFISGGLAAEETGTRGGIPDPDKVAGYLAGQQMSPLFTIGTLR